MKRSPNILPSFILTVFMSLFFLMGFYARYQMEIVESQPITVSNQFGPLPDFQTYNDVGEKKNAFFAYLAPIAKQANQVSLERRTKIIALSTKLNITQEDIEYLKTMASLYKVSATDIPGDDLFRELKAKVDEIPLSLILAQAANESAWGTSRFARKANNIFGLWCYSPGCGLVPKKRSEGANHEVARFSSIYLSVRSYIRNINSHPGYETLRTLRQEARDSGIPLDGETLAQGLLSYSERGEPYVREIQSLIRTNKLNQYEQP
ncbi:MAG: glucosaminidase domain-containing protein [Hahellaceae bacterium]|nr:glucosaminidase domain-containing protein [Hahellaceae bacterium]